MIIPNPITSLIQKKNIYIGFSTLKTLEFSYISKHYTHLLFTKKNYYARHKKFNSF